MKTPFGQVPLSVINQLPAMIAYWDSGLNCRFSNDKYLEWFGLSPEKMDGISMRQLMGEELFAMNKPFITGALMGRPQTFERTLHKAAGGLGHTVAQYTPDIDARGKVRGFYAVVTDMGRQAAAETRLNDASRADPDAEEHAPQGLEDLTARQLEVVRLVALGNSSKQIAERLGISFRTVELHRAAAARKMGVRTTAGLVSFAIRHRLIEA